jgi:phage terminase large subunit-like protein
MPTSESSDFNDSTLLKRLHGGLTALETNKGRLYRPYPKQVEFHNAGKTHRQRLFMAGNRLGKTLAGGMEVYFHATGLYPDWWEGRVFKNPVKIIVSGRTAETTRDVPQLMLMGEPESWGTGCIPRSHIGRTVLGRGLTDALDSVSVLHKTGHASHITFKQYSQERLAFEGYDADIVWFDEEPKFGVYGEGLTRTHSRNGIVFVTFTPLQGMSDVVQLFYPHPDTPSHSLTRMGIRDVEHFEDVEEIIASYPHHLRQARANGEPTLGTGKVFPIDEDGFAENPLKEVPEHWFQIGGIDFGYDHPTACVKLAEDRDNDTLHVITAYRQRLQTPVVHAAQMKAVGGLWLPWAWPQDGYQHDKQSGMQIAANYRDEQGVDMLPQHAQFENGSIGLEAGVMEMYDRLQTGRLRVDRNLGIVFDEIRVYHRGEDGQIVKKKDDVLCAIRYAMMMRRYGIQRRRKATAIRVITDHDDPLNPPNVAA